MSIGIVDRGCFGLLLEQEEGLTFCDGSGVSYIVRRGRDGM